MNISAKLFGQTPGGDKVYCYTLESDCLKVEILNYGGIIRALYLPDKTGRMADIVLGHKNLEDYVENKGYLGCAVGRSSNRISGASFRLFDEKVTLEQNDGENNLHTGSGGLHRRLFTGEVHTFNNLPALLLSHTIEDGSDGFPGNLIVTIAYALTEDNALMIDYRAVSDKNSLINLTNHSYFNLAGHDSGNIYGHTLEMDAQFYTPVDSKMIPTGEVLRVKDTPFDFATEPKPLGRDIHSALTQINRCEGYDHNFVLGGTGYRKVATLAEPESGRVMSVLTDLPGVQLYTGNHLDGEQAYKDGVKYPKHAGVCLETQFFPNAANTPWFPTPFFAAGEEYTSTTTYQFSIKDDYGKVMRQIYIIA